MCKDTLEINSENVFYHYLYFTRPKICAGSYKLQYFLFIDINIVCQYVKVLGQITPSTYECVVAMIS